MQRSRNRLLALLAANRDKPKRYEIRQQADEATIYLYDAIDPFWGISASQFVKDLNALDSSVINVRINSPGGDVFDGRAIANAIAQHKSRIIAHVDGLAASAASYVAIAAREVVMGQGSMMMIHNAWTFAYGNAEDLLATAGVLQKIDDGLVQTYAKKTGASDEQIREWMAAETWFTAEEAVTQGFADRVAEDGDQVSNSWDLTVYGRAPAAQAAPAPAQVDTEQLDVAHAERSRNADFLMNVA